MTGNTKESAVSFIPPSMARAIAEQRHRDLLAEAEAARLVAQSERATTRRARLLRLRLPHLRRWRPALPALKVSLARAGGTPDGGSGRKTG